MKKIGEQPAPLESPQAAHFVQAYRLPNLTLRKENRQATEVAWSSPFGDSYDQALCIRQRRFHEPGPINIYAREHMRLLLQFLAGAKNPLQFSLVSFHWRQYGLSKKIRGCKLTLR